MERGECRSINRAVNVLPRVIDFDLMVGSSAALREVMSWLIQ